MTKAEAERAEAERAEAEKAEAEKAAAERAEAERAEAERAEAKKPKAPPIKFVDAGDSLLIVRISDLHIWGAQEQEGVRQEHVLMHLLEDLERVARGLAKADAENRKAEAKETDSADGQTDQIEQLRPDLVLITGDVVQAGKKEQYKRALESAIDKICRRLDISRGRVKVVPGNHDVDRATAARVDKDWFLHQKYRGNAVDGMLVLLGGTDGKSLAERDMATIWRKFEAYSSEFAAKLKRPDKKSTAECIVSAEKPYWTADWQPRESWRPMGRIRLLGLNSAILSYDNDVDSTIPGPAGCKLALGDRQINEIADGGELELRIVLAHHPPESIRDGLAFERELDKWPHLLFVGHMHQQSAEITGSFVEHGRVIFRADATYRPKTEQHPGSQHGYEWVRLTRAGIEWYPRRERLGYRIFEAAIDGTPNGAEYNRHGIGVYLRIKKNKLPGPLQSWIDAWPKTAAEANAANIPVRSLPPPKAEQVAVIKVPRAKTLHSTPDSPEDPTTGDDYSVPPVSGPAVAPAAVEVAPTIVYPETNQQGQVVNTEQVYRSPATMSATTTLQDPTIVDPDDKRKEEPKPPPKPRPLVAPIGTAIIIGGAIAGVYAAKFYFPSGPGPSTDGVTSAAPSASTVSPPASVPPPPLPVPSACLNTAEQIKGVAGANRIAVDQNPRGFIYITVPTEKKLRKIPKIEGTPSEYDIGEATSLMYTKDGVYGTNADGSYFLLKSNGTIETKKLPSLKLDEQWYPFEPFAIAWNTDATNNASIYVQSKRRIKNKLVFALFVGEQKSEFEGSMVDSPCAIATTDKSLLIATRSQGQGYIYQIPFGSRQQGRQQPGTLAHAFPHGIASFNGDIVVIDRGDAVRDDPTKTKFIKNRTGSLTRYKIGVDGRATVVSDHRGLDNPRCAAFDAQGITWTNYGDGTIQSLLVGQDRPILIGEHQDRPEVLATDELCAYWITGTGDVWTAARKK